MFENRFLFNLFDFIELFERPILFNLFDFITDFLIKNQKGLFITAVFFFGLAIIQEVVLLLANSQKKWT